MAAPRRKRQSSGVKEEPIALEAGAASPPGGDPPRRVLVRARAGQIVLVDGHNRLTIGGDWTPLPEWGRPLLFRPPLAGRYEVKEE